MQSWQFSERESRLMSGDQAIHLPPKAAAVLRCLLRRPHRIVSRDALMEEVWSGLHVTPDLAREYIFDLRAALGDDAKTPTYIETVRGKGFRLIGDIRFAEDNDARSADNRATLAVLRPENFSEAPRWQMFADSVADDIITALTRYSDIAVISRKSSFSVETGQDMRSIAGSLGAKYILESSFSGWDGQLRAQFQLIDGATDAHLWAERIDRETGSLPSLGGDIAEAVSNTIGGFRGELHRAARKVARQKPLNSLNAYEHFLMACEYDEHQYDAEGHRLALEHIEQSTALDPNFARSWLLRYYVMFRSARYVRDRPADEWYAAAERSIEHAYELDPRDPTVLAILSDVRACEGNITRAVELLTRARDLGHNQADACAAIAPRLISLFGAIDKATELLDTAYRLNSNPPHWYAFYSVRVTFLSGDYERCISESYRASRWVAPILYRCLSQTMLGQMQEAKESYSLLRELFPNFEFNERARIFPIIDEPAQARYRVAVEKLFAE